MEKDNVKICPNCESFFTVTRSSQKFCSTWCREDYKIEKDEDEDDSYE